MSRLVDTTFTEKNIRLYKQNYYNLLHNNFKEIGTNMYIWSGFADNELSNFIEKTLYDRGSIVFFVDEVDGVQKALSWALRGGLNIYGEPVAWKVLGVGFNKNLSRDNSVMIQNNKLRTPTVNYVDLLIYKLINIELTIDMNVNAVKNPAIFTGDEKDILMFKNIYRKITENEPVIYRDKNSVGIGEKAFDVVNTGINYIGKELSELYDYYESRIIKHFGLKVVKDDKRERLVVDEANAQNEYSNSNLYLGLEERKKAVKKINEMFGLNISVEINDIYLPKEEEEPFKKEVEVNE